MTTILGKSGLPCPNQLFYTTSPSLSLPSNFNNPTSVSVNQGHFLLSIFTCAALLSACSQDPAQQQTAAPAASATSAPASPDSAVTATLPTSSAPAAAPSAKTVYQLLQGKWQSTTDEKDVVEFKGHDYLDYYDQEQLSSSPFVLAKACPGESGAGAPDDNERYLVVQANDMCWHIAVVDDVSLELETKDNILVYSKIK
jgi:hypothetical protein